MSVTATELARAIGVTPGRVSQLVKSGRLNGCFEGDGKRRRFDAARVAERLHAVLHAGQQTGEGMAATSAREALLLAARPAPVQAEPPQIKSDAARLTRARADEAEYRASQARRQMQLDEGRYLLAAEVARATTAATRQLLDDIERWLLDQTRARARAAGADPSQAVAEVRAAWRDWRARRSGQCAAAAAAASPTAAEAAEMAA